MDASLTIIRRPVKHARLRVGEDGSVRLLVPSDFTSGEVDSVLQKKAGWIERQREFFRAHTGNIPRLASDEVMLFGEIYRWMAEPNQSGDVVDRAAKVIRAGHQSAKKGGSEQWVRGFARAHLRRRVQELSEKHGFKFEQCFVLSQRTRWGSCSTKKNISLNWRLVAAPEYAIDYVILHELVHTQVLDHSHRFWVNLRAVCPDTERAVAWLNANRPTLALAASPTGKEKTESS